MSHGGGGSAESPSAAPQPTEATTAAEFTAALRALRMWSGLTYRQLEGKTAAHQDRLPPSTIATTLGRATLPREHFVDTFTRACGLGDAEVLLWLKTRRHIAIRAADEDDDEPVPVPTTGTPVRSRVPRWRRVASLLAATVIGIVGTLAVDAVFDRRSAPASPSVLLMEGPAIRQVGSWARIHPARTPQLCLTEDRPGRHATAVQRSCADTTLPHVFIEPLGADVVQIQLHHPDHGIRCLAVLLDRPDHDFLELRGDCTDYDPAQRFRVEPSGPPGVAHVRIHTVVTDLCLGLRDRATSTGAEIVQVPCSTASDQEFLIEPTTPP
ncbi:helix-turn-helix domain-containing protein [Saccharothrix sp. Mg75]|uniref:helix-turn-helix domain-containing protein n=1 Tax=Saccharothrix sp. Mg75 TaxID=3445357 RepID=UPI003EEB9837